MNAVVLGVAVRDIQIEFGGDDANSFRLAIAEMGQLAFDTFPCCPSRHSGISCPSSRQFPPNQSS